MHDLRVNCFSALTYHNPCLPFMRDLLAEVLQKRGLSYQSLELVVIEGGEEERTDVLEALEGMGAELNYLMLLTDEPEYYKDFVHRMYVDYGLIVQRMPKDACPRTQGNLALDFERLDNPATAVLGNKKATRIPVYKKAWEIGENLDITVPVGYNTLVVTGSAFLQPDDWQRITGGVTGENIDRLDQEFRKG